MADVKWIKMDIDIFNNRKIKQIEILPDGDALIVIWVKLLCLAGNINDGGAIYLTEEIPYTEQMLATEFGRPLATIQLALQTFEQFGMVEVIDDILRISNWERYQNIEGMERIKEQNRIRKQRQRERERLLINDNHVTSRDSHAIEEEKKREEKEEDKNIKRSKAPLVFFPDNERLNSLFKDFVDMRKKIRSPMTDKAIDLAIKKLKDLADEGGFFDENLACDIIEQSIMNSWKGLFPLKESKRQESHSIVNEWMKA